MVDIKLYAAPMEGLTTYIWRRAQREVFGGVDKYFTPFLSPNGNLAFQQKELDEVTQGETDTVPQLLTNRGDYFVWAARELYAMGVREVNFNLGCPSGTVTAKRKGAGLLAYPEELDRCLEEVFAALPDMRVSIKTRIGKNDPAEWERLLAIYGKYPVSELIVHPRVQKEFYRGAVHRDAFELALARRREPPVYNGDLFTVAEVEDFCRQYPRVRAVMLGRGLVADPALGRRLRGGAAASRRCRVAAGVGDVPSPAAGGLPAAVVRRYAGAAPDAGAVELSERQLRRRGAGTEGHPQGTHAGGVSGGGPAAAGRLSPAGKRGH